MKKETLSTIAARTGFSAATVSRVLNGTAQKYRISIETCRTVEAEAKRCNYTPSITAQSLRTQKSRMIGLLLPGIHNAYFAEIASVVITELNKLDYTTIAIDTMEDDRSLINGIRSLIGRHVEGIIAVPSSEDSGELDLLERQIPIVTIDRYYENSSIPYVATNNFQGGLEGTRKLISHGYKNIVCIQGNNSTPNKERVRGFWKAAEDAGISDSCYVTGNAFSVQNGYLETKLLLGKKDRPRAIFALGNTILLGVLKAAKENNFKIPDDIAVVSFDDNIYMDYFNPSIARIGQPVEDMGTLAVKILLSKIEGTRNMNSQILLSPTFIDGESY